MKIKGLEVSGLTRIVINRKCVWERWAGVPEVSNNWYMVKPDNKNHAYPCKKSQQMKAYVETLIKTRRVWVCGDTLNIAGPSK